MNSEMFGYFSHRVAIVCVRSLNGVTASSIKDLLQRWSCGLKLHAGDFGLLFVFVSMLFNKLSLPR